MFFPGFSSPVRRKCLLPSSLAGGPGLEQVGRCQLVAAESPARNGCRGKRILCQKIQKIPTISNRRFSYMFAPPSTSSLHTSDGAVIVRYFWSPFLDFCLQVAPP